MRSIPGLIFDLDGTLVHTLPDVTASLNAVLGRRPLDVDEVRTMVGHGAIPMIEMALEATGGRLNDRSLPDILEAYLDHYRTHPTVFSEVYPDVYDVLDRLAGQGIPMGICTNKPSATTGLVLDSFDLAKYFKVVVCGDSVPHKKPDGRHILLTLEQMKINPNGAVMIGDSESDIDAAIDAGISSIAVSFGYSIKSPETLGADTTIHGFSTLEDALIQISTDKA